MCSNFHDGSHGNARNRKTEKRDRERECRGLGSLESSRLAEQFEEIGGERKQGEMGNCLIVSHLFILDLSVKSESTVVIHYYGN